MYIRNTHTAAQSPLVGSVEPTLAECPKKEAACEYPMFSVPPSLQGRSGEPGQILLEGRARKLSLYHGWFTDFSIRDRELDWHVYFDLSNSTKQTILSHLKGKGCTLTPNYLSDVWSELMVLDYPKLIHALIETPTGWKREGELGFRSADVTLPFRLSGSKHPAWDLSRIAAANQHKEQDFSKYSRLVKDGAFVYQQGPFVNDAFHFVRLEIHPIDSIAFAIDKDDKTIGIRQGEPGWPTNILRWRVAAFTNSGVHRVNQCPSLNKERKTTWFLNLPSDANKSGSKKKVQITPLKHKLWDGIKRKWYDWRGVSSVKSGLEKDPTDGLLKLKVEVVMKPADDLGGMFVRDFHIQVV